MGSDTFYGDFIVKLIWRLSDNLIYRGFYIENPKDFRAHFTIKFS